MSARIDSAHTALGSVIETMANPEVVGRLDDLCFHAPLTAVEQFGAEEFVIRVELEAHLAGAVAAVADRVAGIRHPSRDSSRPDDKPGQLWRPS